MYPNLYYLLREIFGLQVPFLKAIGSAGFFMTLSFIPGGWLWYHELKYKEKKGELNYITKTIIIGRGIHFGRICLHFILGFLAGFKFSGLLVNQSQVHNYNNYLFSRQGSYVGGFLCAIIWAGYTFYENYKSKTPHPQKEVIRIYPHEYVSKGLLVAALSGIIGSKVFGALETWHDFIKHPLANLFSSEGFAFLGGFIVATFAMWIYHYRFSTQRMQMADALAPSIMLSYGLGRIGCQVAGDGDWGINHPAPNPYAWLPNWLWSYDYPHNVLRKGIYIQGCSWDDYCYKLGVPVYPTPLYELFLCLVIVLILLFALRHEKVAGRVSAYCLMLMSIERFFIENIRVDIRYHFLGMQPTQAQILSVLCFCCGIALYFIAPKLNANKTKGSQFFA